ncbi:MAG: hemagglutinin [Pseudomonadota bacterium]
MDVRAQYEAAVIELQTTTTSMLAAGNSEEDVARWAVARRNHIKQQFRELTPGEALATIEAWTLARYGHAVGPTADQLRASGKSWCEILVAASRPGKTPDGV